MKWGGSSLKGLSPNLWDLNVPSGNLQVDSIRSGLNCRIPGWYQRITWCGKTFPHI